MKEFYFSSLYISYGLLILALFFGIKRYFLLSNKEKWYLFYSFFLLLIEITTNVLIEIFNFKDTSFMYPIFIAGEFFILTGLYLKKLNFSNYWFVSVLTVTIGILLSSHYFTATNDYIKAVSNIIIICFAGYTLLQEIKSDKKENNFLSVDAFIFMYYSVSVFIFILQHQLTSLSEKSYFIILGANNILLIVFYSSLIYTFSRLKKQLIR